MTNTPKPIPTVYRIAVVGMIVLGVSGIGLGLYNWYTGAEEWRPGSTLDALILLVAVVANLIATTVLTLSLRSQSSISRMRMLTIGLLLLVSVVFLIVRVLRG